MLAQLYVGARTQQRFDTCLHVQQAAMPRCVCGWACLCVCVFTLHCTCVCMQAGSARERRAAWTLVPRSVGACVLKARQQHNFAPLSARQHHTTPTTAQEWHTFPVSLCVYVSVCVRACAAFSILLLLHHSIRYTRTPHHFEHVRQGRLAHPPGHHQVQRVRPLEPQRGPQLKQAPHAHAGPAVLVHAHDLRGMPCMHAGSTTGSGKVP